MRTLFWKKPPLIRQTTCFIAILWMQISLFQQMIQFSNMTLPHCFDFFSLNTENVSKCYEEIATYNTRFHQSGRMLQYSKCILKRMYGFSFLNESMNKNTSILKVIDITAIICFTETHYLLLCILFPKLINQQRSPPVFSFPLLLHFFGLVLFCCMSLFFYLSVRTLEWICSSGLVSEETGCELESQAHFLQMTETDSGMINSGWCEAAMLVQ